MTDLQNGKLSNAKSASNENALANLSNANASAIASPTDVGDNSSH